MKLNNNVAVTAGFALMIAATYIGLGVSNSGNIAHAEHGESHKADLSTDKGKLGYAYGAQLAADMQRGGITTKDIDLDAMAAAMHDVFDGKDPQVSVEDMQQAQQNFQAKRQAEFQSLANDNKEASEKFVTENAKKKGVTATDSGLQYEAIREGKGKQPTATDTVKVHYVGTLIDGTKFDSSRDRGAPADFPVSGVIPGFSEGLQLMKEGAKYRFVIPAGLAYGEQGPGSIGPNQALIFEVELIEVVTQSTTKKES